ncbi:MAG: hypothetical protein ACR2PZ_18055 [Pseudomonadales bacterium]
MVIKTRRLLAAVILVFMAANATAAELVRDAALIETVPLQGVTLAMTPKAAFEHLSAQGFRAGNIQAFEDWEGGGIEFVRGVYGSPDGHTSLVIGRHAGRIIQLSETHSQPGRPLDADSEIGAARQHLRITADTVKCAVANPHYGNCRVQDAKETEDVDLVYGLQIMSIMRLAFATRNKELAASFR